jgi:hypothetical protein
MYGRALPPLGRSEARDHGRRLLVAPEVAKGFRRQFRVSDRVPDILVAMLSQQFRLVANSPELAGIRLRISLCRLSIGFRGPFRRLCLCLAKSRFPR